MFGNINLYKVYIDKDAANPIDEAIFIKDGFSFLAFIFNVFWAAFYRLWGVVLIYIFFISAVTALEIYGFVNLEMSTVLRLGFTIWFAFEAVEWRSEDLERKGYTLYDVVSGKNEQDAQRRFLDFNISSVTEMIEPKEQKI